MEVKKCAKENYPDYPRIPIRGAILGHPSSGEASTIPVRDPSLCEINTRVWLTDLSRTLGRRAKLDNISDAGLARLALIGFDWVWYLSVWQTSPEPLDLTQQFGLVRRASQVPDRPARRGQSRFGFRHHPPRRPRRPRRRCRTRRLLDRLKKQGLKLMLDFVPNHIGLGQQHSCSFQSGLYAVADRRASASAASKGIVEGRCLSS
jgi:hypothetical protein